MKLTMGFSPCPNDTFIFDALVNSRIDTGGLTFEPILEDVETLNQLAARGQLDITKLSFPALFAASDRYLLLPAGSALGKGVGPLLIAREQVPPDEVPGRRIAIPGINTTANLLLGFAFPDATHKVTRVFSGIEAAVLSGETDLGVIIHENRFTYARRGLKKIMDLGEHWESRMQVPIPLGGIAMRRSLGSDLAGQVSRLIRQSLEDSFSRYPAISEYTRRHAQEMEEQVMRQHIELYVNQYSLDLGQDGRHAVKVLYGVYRAMRGESGGAEPEALFL
ncbi:MAG TPA: 1,4-dihydroxy-6-naphthoate synthase [Chitinophagaceae bacterium]|nr:1,4-dihydroxy-6-naphthoate synthase [Chitinophagaceae bacterium]